MASSLRNGLKTSVLHPVWRKLPVELVEVVLKCIPLESLVHFRAVCKRFNILITTPKFARECKRQQAQKSVPVIIRHSIPSDLCSMEVFNSETNTWLVHPLPTLEPIYYPLWLSAASGGLVCFITQRYGTFVVCNPLTGAFRLLECLYPVDSNICTDVCVKVAVGVAFTSLVVDLQAGTFTLVIVTTYDNEAERNTFVYDSITRSWRSGASLPGGDYFIYVIKTLTFDGSIYVLLQTLTVNKLLKYNVCKDNWIEIWTSDRVGLKDRVDILEYQGQVVVMNLTRLQYIDLQTNPPNNDLLLDRPLTLCKVIQAAVDHGEILVEDRVMAQDLHSNVNSYMRWTRRWIGAASFYGDLTTVGIGNVICITRDKYSRYPMPVLHFNCSSKKSSLLPVCRMVKSSTSSLNKFEFSLLEPSLTTDL